jgi:parvulin-like peptidyl-prolyl isomerase
MLGNSSHPVFVMVNLLRRFQQPVLITLTFFVIIAFVILYGGPGTRLDRLGSQHIAKIYDRNVQPAEYNAIGRMFEVCRTLGMLDVVIPLAQNARTMGEVTSNYVWNTMVLRRQAGEMGIEPTDNQVAEAIQKLSAFQKSGQYDHERYLQMVQMVLSPRGMTSLNLEELMRDQIRLQTLRELLGACSAPAPDELEASYAQRHQKVEVALVRIQKEEVAKGVSVTAEEIQKAFEARKEGLKAPEKRKVQHVFFALPEKAPTVAAPSAEEMQKVADQAADFSVAATAAGAKFEEVAKQFAQELKSSPLFGRGEALPEFANQNRVTAAAFLLSEEKPVSEPVPTDKGYYILRLEKIEAARPLTLEEAKEQLNDSLKADKVRETLALKAADVRKKIEEALKAGKTFVQAAETTGYKAELPEAFSKSDSTLKGPESGLVQNALSDLKPGGTSQPLDGPEATLLVHLIGRQPIDSADFELKKKELTAMLQSQRADGLLSEWVDRKRAAAGLQMSQVQP